MYHDQGQIAMKLMGFDRGVTLMGGFPFPICTPAHGTAYDIAGKGIANVGATRAALLLAAQDGCRAARETTIRPPRHRNVTLRQTFHLEDSSMSCAATLDQIAGRRRHCA